MDTIKSRFPLQPVKHYESMRISKGDLAKALYEGTTFDCALPQDPIFQEEIKP